jgi:hypothetical protein
MTSTFTFGPAMKLVLSSKIVIVVVQQGQFSRIGAGAGSGQAFIQNTIVATTTPASDADLGKHSIDQTLMIEYKDAV